MTDQGMTLGADADLVTVFWPDPDDELDQEEVAADGGDDREPQQ